MQIYRRLQRFGDFEDLPEFGVVEEFTPRMGVDDHALETQPMDSAFDFLGSRPWVLRRRRRQSREARGVSAHGFSDLIIGFDGQRVARRSVENLHARRCQRQDLQVDADGVHVGEPSVADVAQPFDQLLSRTQPRPQRHKTWIIDGIVARHFEIGPDQLWGRPGLFRRNAPIVPPRSDGTWGG